MSPSNMKSKALWSDIPSPAMSSTRHIKPFQPEHALDVAALVQQYFPFHKEVSVQYLAESLIKQNIEDHSTEQSSPSLVYFSDDSTIAGFLAVKARAYQFKKQMLTVAHASKFIMSEDSRSSLMAIRVLQQFMKGPQDLSITDDANEGSKLLWQRLGAKVLPEHSIYFKLPLRPLTFASGPIRKKVGELGQAVARTMTLGLDYLAGRFRIPYFYYDPSKYELRYLSNDLLMQGHRRMMSKYDLYPAYDLDTIDHLLHLAQREIQFGQLQRVAMMDEDRLVGWFIYYLNRGNSCELLEAQAYPGHERDLFNALSWHVHQKGGVQLSGRLMLAYFGTPFSLRSLALPGYMWTLAHSNKPELLREVMASRSYIPRL